MKLFFLITLITVFVSGSFEDLSFDHHISELNPSSHVAELDCHDGKDGKEDQKQNEGDEKDHCGDHFFHCLKICNALSFEDETNLLALSITQHGLYLSPTNHYTNKFDDSIYRPPILHS